MFKDLPRLSGIRDMTLRGQKQVATRYFNEMISGLRELGIIVSEDSRPGVTGFSATRNAHGRWTAPKFNLDQSYSSIINFAHFTGTPKIFLETEDDLVFIQEGVYASGCDGITAKSDIHIPSRIITLDDLGTEYTELRTLFDFQTNGQAREVLKDLQGSTVPARLLARVSGYEGRIRNSGLEGTLRLRHQNTEEEYFCNCYEIEIREGDSSDFSKETPVIAPASYWQEDQRHYCITSTESYPLIPVDLDRMRSLAIVIRDSLDYHTISVRVNPDGTLHVRQPTFPEPVHEAFGKLPVSLDGSNEWRASGFVNGGVLEIYHPSDNEHTQLVYTRIFNGRIRANNVYDALNTLNEGKQALEERLLTSPLSKA